MLNNCTLHFQVPDDIRAMLPSYHTVQGIIYRQKRLNQPPLPRHPSEIEITEHYSETVNGRRFFLFRGEQQGRHTLCFATDQHLRLLSEAEHIFVDGTFFTCPNLFYQILTISVEKHNKHIIVAFLFLPGKSQADYTFAFNMLLRQLERRDLRVSLESTRTDFELALIAALRAVFTPTQQRGCHFHFGQAVWQNAKRCGLSTLYKRNENVCIFIRKTVALAFVSLTLVRTVWGGLAATAPQLPQVAAFVEYFNTTWMRGQYPLALWNQFGNRGPRTNNATESWHK